MIFMGADALPWTMPGLRLTALVLSAMRLPVAKILLGGMRGLASEIGLQAPDSLIMDCVRLCCSLCLMENDPSIAPPMCWPTTGTSTRPPATRSM